MRRGSGVRKIKYDTDNVIQIMTQQAFVEAWGRCWSVWGSRDRKLVLMWVEGSLVRRWLHKAVRAERAR